MESVTAKPTLKNRTIWILAAAITALDFIVMALTSEMAYLTIDDGSIENVLSGAFTGSPYPIQQYVNVLESYPITWLYRLIPGVNWWYVISMAMVAAGIFLVHLCLLRLASKNRVFLPVAFGILIFLDIGFFLYPIANIAFTIVPAIFGAGLVACLFWRAEAETVRYENWFFAGCLAGYALLFCHRRMAGLVVLCFLLLAYLYYHVSRNTNWKKTLLKIVVTFAVFLAATWALTAVNSTVQNRNQPEGFNSFNYARSAYMDYPHDTYDQNPELYESVGWDRDIYMLVSSWCYLEDEVTAEDFRYLTQNSEYTTAETSWRELAKEIYEDDQDRAILELYLASILIALFVLIVCRSKKNLIFWLLNNIGAITLLAYQIFTGRAFYRSLMVVLVPAVVINIMLSMNRTVEKKAVRIVYDLFVLAMGAFCVYPMLPTTFDREHNADIAASKEKETLMREYRAAHPDNFYIRQTGAEPNIDPLYTGPNSSNSYAWGGATFYSAAYEECLKANGLTELNGDTFKLDNVYFISGTDAMNESYHDDSHNRFAALLRYLENRCGAVGFVQEDVITDGAYVYHFVFEENEEDYDIYYNIVDGYTVEVDAAAAD